MTLRLDTFNIDEIPPGGKEFSFELDAKAFNERLSLNKGLVGPPTVLIETPKARLDVEVGGVTVLIKGESSLLAEAVCSRCSELTEIKLNSPVSMVLKPKRKDDEVEDLNIGFYEGKEVHLGPIIEEHLILGLPFRVLCKEDCLGLCPKCGENLNFSGKCQCNDSPREIGATPGVFTPFADLKSKFKV